MDDPAGGPIEDDALIEQARHGDSDAYGRLVQRHAEVSFRTAYLVTRDAAEAEDATQDAFVKAYRALARFRPGAPFRPWLLRIVANEARNRRRSSGRRLALAELAAAELDPAASAPSPEAQLLAGERRQMLLDALAGLSDADRLVIGYRYFLDLTEAEMAAALDCPRGTVKSRLSRALARLRERVPSASPAPPDPSSTAGGSE
jgi:RNA polymerase sigma-70 factor (ECF subfamily)